MTWSQFCMVPKPPLRNSRGGVPPGVSTAWSWVSAAGIISCPDMAIGPFGLARSGIQSSPGEVRSGPPPEQVKRLKKGPG